ncbi:MAG: YbbR-like domain-containing protein [Eudoraea sp.]|nr:YbbR-like domain-containing protein [Eudoraea sp.]
MFKKIRQGLNQRKVQIFLLFLVVAFLLRSVSKLSEEYTKQSTFWISYSSQPDSIRILPSTRDQVPVRLKGSGFTFLAYSLNPKAIKLDLSDVNFRNNTYYVPSSAFEGQIRDQLSGSMQLLDVGIDTLFIECIAVIEKEVPVEVRGSYSATQNHLIDGPVKILPKTVTLVGPRTEIDTIKKVRTLAVEHLDLTEDFNFKEELIVPENLLHTTISPSQVEITGTVYKFSEKLIDVPVTVLNVPAGMEIKTFPEQVQVLCRAKLDRLKTLTASDFTVSADYNTVQKEQLLQVSIQEQPKDIPSAQLLDTHLEFILRRL